MPDVFCDYCGRRAEYVDSSEVYGEDYGKIYLCRPCQAWVGVHKGSDKPLGRLANAELRHWKRNGHNVFDPLWKYGPFSGRRNAAYAWLAEKMGLPVEKTHFGMFDVAQCKRAIAIIFDALKGELSYEQQESQGRSAPVPWREAGHGKHRQAQGRGDRH